MTNKTTLQLLPLIQPAQAQKHVTVNAAMMALDVLVQTVQRRRGRQLYRGRRCHR
jgi:hypothetical protein